MEYDRSVRPSLFSRKIYARSAAAFTLTLILLLAAPPLTAGGHWPGQYSMQHGAMSSLSNGDYVGCSTGLDTYYSYFIEVPPGTTQMIVALFDLEIGNNNDLIIDSEDTSVRYTLYDPSGAAVSDVTVDPGEYDECDDGWYYFTGMKIDSPAAGHWELRVDMSSAVNPGPAGDDDINTFGVWAFDSNKELQYSFPLSSDPGWTTEGAWAWGTPAGGGGLYGNPDPTSGYTGSNVYGYNLAGDYTNSMPGYHLTTTAIDCSGLAGVELSFWRWLNVEDSRYDNAYVYVSNNGATWTPVYHNPGGDGQDVADSAWTQLTYDISAVADNQSTVYIRWTMGTTDSSWVFSGWNIDDVEIWADSGETAKELNVYAESFLCLGVMGDAGDSVIHELHPYVTSGSTFYGGDFDSDSGASYTLTSRTAAFSQTTSSSAVYAWDLSTDPGWTTQGDWEWGTPTGSGGSSGNPDPTSGYSGSNVYGYNIYGDYANSMSETCLTSSAIDCTGLSGVHVRYWYWLGVQRYRSDHAYFRVSNDGTTWTTIWQNPDSNLNGGSWESVDLDISSVADGQSTVYLRWVMGSTNPNTRYCGWNIDDVELCADDNALWGETSYSSWTEPDWAADYGVWDADLTVSIPPGFARNWLTYYFGSSAAASPPPSSQPEDGTFRIYFSSDSHTAPEKPFVTQTLSWVSGPNPPVSGSTTRVRVRVSVFNATGYDITFSASNLVAAYVPGSGAVYAGNAAVTQGSIASQPSVGGSGAITWNPGTVSGSAKGTVSLTYDVDVTPTSSGQTIGVTGTSAANGTTATFVDETGDTVNARATFTFGPLGGLSATEGGNPVPTLAALESFDVYEDGGRVVVRWRTEMELGTAGFDLYRLDGRGRATRLNERLLPARGFDAGGAEYRFVDETAAPGERLTYRLVEVETRGQIRPYGPFHVDAGRRPAGAVPLPNGEKFARESLDPPETKGRLQSIAGTPSLVKAAAKGDRLRLGVREAGLYVVPAARLAELFGVTETAARRLIAGGKLGLEHLGAPAPLLRAADGSAVYFYGEAPPAPFSPENVYWLRKTAARDMVEVTGPGPAPFSGPLAFLERARFETDAVPAPDSFDDPAADFWMWDSLLAGDPVHGRKDFTVTVPDVAPLEVQAALAVLLHGGSETAARTDHHVKVLLNGTPVGEGQWDGLADHRLEVQFPRRLLTSGPNTVTLQAVLDEGVPHGLVYLDRLELSYPRLYRAVDGRLRCRGDGHPVVTIEGFGRPDLALFDVTDPSGVKRVQAITVQEKAGGNFTLSFRPESPGAEYLALPLAAAARPELALTGLEGLRRKENRAEYLVIAPAALLGPARTLAAYRQAGGLEARVVALESVYNEFSDGLATPAALRAFLAYADRHWRLAPAYVVLAGKGTLDYRDVLGYGDNQVPLQLVATGWGLFPADAAYAPDGWRGSLGRLPAVDAAELEVMVEKTIAFENMGGAWRERVLLAADDPDGGGNFPAGSDALVASIGSEAKRIYLSEYPVETARELLRDWMREGAGFVNYLGHGSVERLAAEGLLRSADVAGLENGSRLPVLTAFTCVLNQFGIPGYRTLSERLMMEPDGGMAAVWAPSGMSDNAVAAELARRFYEAVYDAGESELGPAIRAAQTGVTGEAAAATLATYLLLGDPALRLRPAK